MITILKSEGEIKGARPLSSKHKNIIRKCEND